MTGRLHRSLNSQNRHLPAPFYGLQRHSMASRGNWAIYLNHTPENLHSMMNKMEGAAVVHLAEAGRDALRS